MAWVLSEYVMTMYAIGEPLARCLLLGKQWRDRGRVGIASSRCHLVRESKVSTSREQGSEVPLPPGRGKEIVEHLSKKDVLSPF